MDTYKQCPRKYYYKYVEKLEKDVTHSPLLFGSALDNALNYILTCLKKKRHFKLAVAKWLFFRTMKKWQGQNTLVYFKKELPDGELPTNKKDLEWAVWHNLVNVGQMMLDTYVSDIIPQFEEVLDVQIKREIENSEGDVLVIIADFKAKLKDGRIATLDNKSASNPYTKDAVKTSQQLAIYIEHLETPFAGYVVLQKKPKNGKIEFDILVDSIEESVLTSVYEEMSTIVGDIKANKFSKNEKSCFAFGKPCDYAAYCKYGNKAGLIPSKR